ncbi:hypothetical protein UFOVP45_128 [uncultured Caudovirales phage]|uniref:Uncharacterized protein n=1 Tax=uncultured Caudovirales phage TaxID=2100421 RepID=A0A6J5KT52_9CAUD|nr:hypothetical protein UFOVP45_128 [uncultured Caudovirales phage]
MGRNNADFRHPLYEGGERPMYRWMHQGEYDEAQSAGEFKARRNVSPQPQDTYSEKDHVLVKFTSPTGRWRKKDLEGRQANFYMNNEPIPFEHGQIVDKGRKA